MSFEHRKTVLRILALAVGVVLSVLAFLYREEIRHLAFLGYLGAFLMPMLANATVFVPVPGILVIFTMGGVYNPWIVAILGGLGAAIGELSGYLVGYSGQGLAEKVKYYDRAVAWMAEHRRWSHLMITVMALIPNPFFDAAGIAAGTLRIPVGYFLLFTAIGSILKMLAIALAGNSSSNWLLPPAPHLRP
jgi:uncharacterized membrane protein YdjX (TVP38/TMEM64 family)